MKVIEELIDQDKEIPEDVRSMEEIVKMANSICPILQFTGDCPGANANGKLPILDICCWIENDQVIYEHYNKPIASNLLIMQRSAMPDRVKRATITQMAIKILENTSQNVPWARRAQLLSRFSLRMKHSGYNERFRLNIFQSALKNWDKKLTQDQTGERPLHREKSWRRGERRREKEKKERTWYAERTSNDAYTTFPIFCPATPNGALAKSWRKIATEIAEQSEGRVNPKIVEQGGIPIKNVLCKKSPAEGNECGKADCPVCLSGKSKGKNCLKVTQGGAGYIIRCMTCDEQQVNAIYHGETGRTLYSRLTEHRRGHEKKQDTNPLYKHDRSEHNGNTAAYSYEPVGFYHDPLTRQVNEGVRINRSLADRAGCTLMNSRAEFRQGSVPRVQFVRGLME